MLAAVAGACSVHINQLAGVLYVIPLKIQSMRPVCTLFTAAALHVIVCALPVAISLSFTELARSAFHCSAVQRLMTSSKWMPHASKYCDCGRIVNR